MVRNKEGGKKIVKRKGMELVRADSDIIKRGLEAIRERSDSLHAERAIQIVCIGVDKLVQSAYYPAILESQSMRTLGESNHKQAAVDVYKSTNPDVVVIFRNADRQGRSHGSASSVAGKPWGLPGIDSGIDSEVPQAFNDTSTTHIIAISGFKLLSIVALYRNDIGKFSHLIHLLLDTELILEYKVVNSSTNGGRRSSGAARKSGRCF